MKLNRTAVALVAVNGVLTSALAWALLSGAPAVQWAQPDTPAPVPLGAPAALRQAELPLGERSVAWQQPLFSPDRQPDPQTSQPEARKLDGVRLTGVVVDNQASWALLRLANQRNVKLKQGEALDDGWVLHQVAAGSATFQRQGLAYTLNLHVPRLPAPGAHPLIALPHVTAP